MPKLKCEGRRQAIAASVGAFVGGSGRPSAAALFMGCYSGRAHYWPELVVNGSVENHPTKVVQAGDTIVLRLDTRQKDHVAVVDETQGFKVSRSTPRGRSAMFAWIGDEGWIGPHDHLEGVPDFGTLTYSHTELYGRSVGDGSAGWIDTPENRSGPPWRTSAGTLQIETSKLFEERRQRVPAPTSCTPEAGHAAP